MNDRTTDPRRRRRTLVAVAAVVALALAGAVLTVAARAADTVLGTLTFRPASGATIDPASVGTSSTGTAKGCPAGSVTYVGRMTGPGGWAAGVVVISRGSANLSTTADFSADLSDTFDGIARSESLAITPGRYTLTLSCDDEVGVTTFGVFTAPLWFTSATSWQSTDPAAGPTAAATTTTLAADPPSGSTAGQQVTLTATVAPSAATGTVEFKDGSTSLGTGQVSAGVATLRTTALAAGSHPLTAVFTPTDPTAFSLSVSTVLTYRVTASATAAATTTTLSLSPATGADASTPVTLSAAVVPAAAGTVRFEDVAGGAATVVGTAPTVVGPTSAVAEATATFTAGSHTVRAVFVPADLAAFSGSTSAEVTYSVATAGGGGSVPRLGTLVFEPASGTANDPVTATTVSTGTPKGCPAQTTSVTGFVVGPGAWASGIVVVGRTSANISTSADFNVELADTFAGIASVNSLTIEPGKYVVQVFCQDDIGTQTYGGFEGSLFFVDATRFQSQDPSTGTTSTQVSVTASPADRSDVGAPLTLTATVTPTTAAGTVQFRTLVSGDVVAVGPKVTVTGGRAVLTLKDRPFGLYELSAAFTPSDAKAFTPSTSQDLLHVVALPLPPLPPRTAVLTGAARVGSTVRCTGTFRNATSTRYVWLRGRAAISGATRATYRVVRADRGRQLTCRILATNAGGTTQRTSATKVVPR